MSKYKVDIQKELDAIAVTPYGKTMRPNLHDGLEKLARKQNALSDTFDGLIINAGNSNAEVVDARNDTVSQPSVNHNTLGDRLNSMQTTIINHLAIPHITYREVGTTVNVLGTNNDEAIVTNNEEYIETTGILAREVEVTKTKANNNAKVTNVDTVKIPELPTTPVVANGDLLVIESGTGTHHISVENILPDLTYDYI